jgi:hypothetical protein
LESNTTGINNTGVGFNALNANTTAVSNTAVGYNALVLLTAAGNNTAIGDSAMATTTNSNNSVAVGYSAFNALTSGTHCVAVGASAGLVVTTGGSNTFIGFSCGIACTTGANNTALGTSAGTGITTGGSNVIIGTGAGGNITTTSNNIIIVNTAVAGDAGVIRIGTAGTHTTNFQAGIRGATTALGALAVVIDASGQMGTIISLRSRKNTISSVNIANNSEIIDKLIPRRFFYNGQKEKYADYGLIVDEVIDICPDLIAYNINNEPETVKYHHIPIINLTEIKNLRERVKFLEEKLLQLSLRSTLAEQCVINF